MKKPSVMTTLCYIEKEGQLPDASPGGEEK